VKPELFLQLDRVIHEKGRLAIMSMLAASPNLSFTELRDALDMTDGNLTAHTRTLQESEYLAVTKVFQGGRPLTTFALTPLGRAAFGRYIDLLEQILHQTRARAGREQG
jgi:predicted ArsR family transcriptional regulator